MIEFVYLFFYQLSLSKMFIYFIQILESLLNLLVVVTISIFAFFFRLEGSNARITIPFEDEVWYDAIPVSGFSYIRQNA